MAHKSLGLARLAAWITAAALAVTFAQVPTIAAADTKPLNEADPATPVTVAADPLPTVQIDGVAWTQLVIGNTVYVGGNFTTARPAGAAAGTNEVSRSNLLAYNITTGVLNTTWAPTANGEVLALAASPDKSRIYIGGSFTNVNGQIRNRIAALDPTTGALIGAFQPKPDATVKAIAATSTAVYFGGIFSAVGGTPRVKVAAAQASDGALLSWNPVLAGGNVNAIAISPDSSKVAIGGAFTSVNGSSNPGYGLAFLDPSTAASLPLPANTLIRNGGANAAILSLTSDSDSLYVTGYVFGSGGNLEGTARVDWSAGTTTWVEDCHGDTYGSYPMGDVIYTVSHAHYCGNLPDGFPQTSPQWTFHWANSFTKAVVGTLKADPYGYFNWFGNPSPNLLKWLPNLTSGTFTGQGQAGWTVTGNDTYVAIGGEFPRAAGGGTTQQGLVRYAVRTVAPNKIGPELTGSKFNPTLTSFVQGQVRITWPANWDRDNENLTYKVIRDGITASPIYTVTAASSEWTRPAMGYVDTGLVPGQQYRYRIFATDPWGNEARSDTVYVTVSPDGVLSSYGQAVLDDGPTNFWRLGESPSTTVNDWAGFTNATAGTGVTGLQEGAIAGDPNQASTFDGTTNGMAVANTAQQGPDTFSLEAWFKTTSNAGGKIIGFGNANTGNSSSYDRHVYIDSQGRVTFGVYQGATRTLTSPRSYRDGAWHHVVATLGANGMVLYLDGLKVGARTDTTFGQAYTGYWRIGGDNLGSWPSRPSSAYLNGTIDDVAVYPTVLAPAKIRQHYLASGRTLAGSTPPPDAYGAAVYSGEPDFYWRLAESSGTTVNDTSVNQLLGTYAGTSTKLQPSGIGLAGDSSVLFNGSNGTAATQVTFTNPTVYAQELWFRTSTTRGGKLIGFGSSATGNSSSYDRHVYMLNDGKLRFGAYTGVQNIVDSTLSYNDGKWHYLVAQQGSDGMKLYVDAQLVGTNPQTGSQNYTGYWRIGGDVTWGGNTSNYFNGNLDEVAVYSRTLTDAERLDHFLKGGGDLPNVAPTADYTFTVNKLSASFDGAAATDSDGSVVSYLWDFGDGQTSTIMQPTHTFATAGDKSVKLTVTDNEGATGTVTKTVTVVANQPPAVSFSSAVTKKSVDFTSSASDPDGTLVSYLWDFGDGATSLATNPSHTFANVATYNVSLTVTDNDGGTTTVTNPVTTLPNTPPVADFTSSVDKRTVTFNSSGSTDSDGTIASYSWDFGDGATSTSATPTHTYATVGTFDVTLTVTDDNGDPGSVTKQVTTVANASPTASFTFDVAKLKVTFDASGSSDSDGTVASYAWDFGDGGTSTSKTPSHTYAAAGDHDVTLTVTDNDGATDSVTKTVTTTAPAGPLAEDAFGRTVSNGWGSADTGGTWTRYGTASLFSVASGAGQLRLNAAGAGPRVALESVSSASTEAFVKFTLDKVPNGGGAFVSVGARAIGTSDYRAKVKIASNGALTLYLVKVVNGAETTLTSTALGSAYNFTVGSTLQVRVQAIGTAPTTVRAKVWKTTQTEPASWQQSTTDTTAGLQAAGGVGLVGYLSGSSTNFPIVVSFDDLLVTSP
jgi:PKD repeat protein